MRTNIIAQAIILQAWPHYSAPVKMTLRDAQPIASGFSEVFHRISCTWALWSPMDRCVDVGSMISIARGHYGARAREERQNARGVAIVRPMRLCC
jgi:hypothetical protein